MLHQEDDAMQEDTTRVGPTWIAHVRCSALALLAGIASTACLTQEDANVTDEEAITSELTGGETDLYRCAYPMCGGARIKFDSRQLGLRSCTYDARANVLDCEAHAVDSPRMPSAFWNTSAAQLSCLDGLRFSCAGTSDLQSCVCTSATATDDVKYGPVLKVKPKG